MIEATCTCLEDEDVNGYWFKDWDEDCPAHGLPSKPQSCTCHPDDNPPRPCPRKYALTECRRAAKRSAAIKRPDLSKMNATEDERDWWRDYALELEALIPLKTGHCPRHGEYIGDWCTAPGCPRYSSLQEGL